MGESNQNPVFYLIYLFSAFLYQLKIFILKKVYIHGRQNNNKNYKHRKTTKKRTSQKGLYENIITSQKLLPCSDLKTLRSQFFFSTN